MGQLELPHQTHDRTQPPDPPLFTMGEKEEEEEEEGEEEEVGEEVEEEEGEVEEEEGGREEEIAMSLCVTFSYNT